MYNKSGLSFFQFPTSLLIKIFMQINGSGFSCSNSALTNDNKKSGTPIIKNH